MHQFQEILQCPGQPVLCTELARCISFRNSNQTKVQQVPNSEEETLEFCVALRHFSPTTAPLPGLYRQEGALKLSAVDFTSSDTFLKQQHKVLVWLAGNLKLFRQSCCPYHHHHLHHHHPPRPGPAQRLAACQERQRAGPGAMRPRGSPA
jgi:hypothetical protein